MAAVVIVVLVLVHLSDGASSIKKLNSSDKLSLFQRIPPERVQIVAQAATTVMSSIDGERGPFEPKVTLDRVNVHTVQIEPCNGKDESLVKNGQTWLASFSGWLRCILNFQEC